ncbi:MAG: Npt1/Npt2 family nucleotide transporter [Myxococcota bacterium]
MSKTNNRRRNVLEQLLSLFAEVKAGEGLIIILMLANVFMLLNSYYILKTVRESLILTGGMLGLKGSELKIYASAGQAALLLGLVPLYGWLGSRFNRIRLINTTTVFFIGCLVVFYFLARLELALGLAFYLWLGIFNMFVIAQFWSYANDIYSEAQGKRLFAIIAVGGSLGAILGPAIASTDLINDYELMLVAAGILGLCMFLYNVVNRLVAAIPASDSEDTAEASKQDEEPLSKDGGFQLVLQDKYLLLIAVMLLIANLINTTGEFILAETASAYVETTEGASFRDFYGSFYSTVNLIGLLIQAFLVSRIFKLVGVRGALFILPVIAFGGYALIGLIGGIALIRAAKTAENSTDYSLQNTVRQSLFLPTSREVKYKAKAAIDTFFVRAGDAAAAGLVALGTHVLAFGLEHFAFINVGLAAIWIAIVAAIGRRYSELSEQAPTAKARD